MRDLVKNNVMLGPKFLKAFIHYKYALQYTIKIYYLKVGSIIYY